MVVLRIGSHVYEVPNMVFTQSRGRVNILAINIVTAWKHGVLNFEIFKISSPEPVVYNVNLNISGNQHCGLNTGCLECELNKGVDLYSCLFII